VQQHHRKKLVGAVRFPIRRHEQTQDSGTQSPYLEMVAASPRKSGVSPSPFLMHECAAARKREERGMVIPTVQAQGVDSHR